MSLQANYYRTPSATVNSLSGDIWNDCPWEHILLNPGNGFLFFDDFCNGVGLWTATQATAGTFVCDTAATGHGGVVLADCNSATADQGIQAQVTGGGGFAPVASTTLWFEARFKVADTATGPNAFIGLAELDTTVIAAGVMSTANHLGFSALESTDAANVTTFDGEKATAGTRETCTTLVDDTWIQLGFKVDGITTATQYINGAASATTILTANIPLVTLVPTIVCISEGTTAPIMHVDWIRVAQTRA
jgi:hypothetical protein